MSRLTCFSPAKINLYLKVLSQRPDGFHNIKTVFERIKTFKNHRARLLELLCQPDQQPISFMTVATEHGDGLLAKEVLKVVSRLADELSGIVRPPEPSSKGVFDAAMRLTLRFIKS